MELQFLGRHSKSLNLSFVDEVSRALSITLREPEFRLWTVFAWQLFQDANEVLGPLPVSRAFDELHTFAEAAEALLLEIGDVGTKSLKSYEYPSCLHSQVRGVFGKIKSIQTDWVETFG